MIQTPLVIVTPVYEDTESFYQLVQKIESIYQDQATLVAVEDGSLHHLIDVKQCPSTMNLHVLRLERNVADIIKSATPRRARCSPVSSKAPRR